MTSGASSPAATGRQHPLLTVHAERCVHQHLMHSDCRSCVDSCPRQAWTQDSEGLGLDLDACDDCGLCVANCPHEALALPEPAPLITNDHPRTLVLACERVHGATSTATAGQVACLHALNPEWLIQQAQRHSCARVQLACMDCSSCERSPRLQALPQRWQAVAQRLGSSAPRLEWMQPAQWQQLIASVAQPDLARRRFFGRVLKPPSVSQHGTAANHATLMTSQRRALVQRLANAKLAPAMPTLWRILLDQQRCTACMACVKLCPQHAFEHQNSDTGEELKLHHPQCTGCGICSTVCDVQALKLIEPAATSRPPPPHETIQLVKLVCTKCQAPFRLPRDKVSDNSLAHPVCSVCRRGRLQLTQRIVQPIEPHPPL